MTAAGDSLQRVHVRGRSMWPLLHEDDAVDLERVSGEELRPGDIIAFESDDITVLHRVVALRRAGGVTTIREKGDNARLTTELAADRVIGRAVARWRDGTRCNLRVDPCPSLRLLTAGSRWEGNFFDRLHRLRVRLGFGGSRARRSPAGALAGALLTPLRLPGLFLLRRLYREDEGEVEPRVDEWIVELFRRLATQGDGDLPPFGDLDPDIVHRRLDLHGLQSLVQQRLTEGGAGADWPRSIQDALRQARYRAAFQHVASMATLRDVVEALGGVGVSGLILKGPPLSWELYGEGALRPSGDVDVLVRRGDLDRVIERLSQSGYRVRGAGWQQALVRRGHFHIVLDATRKGRVPIEVHWDLVDRANLYRIDTASVFAAARSVRMPDVTSSVLGVEEGFVYLCLHLTKHALFNRRALQEGEPTAWYARPASGNRLVWFMDLHAYLRCHRGALDPVRLGDVQRRWNAEEDVATCLRVLQHLTGAAEVAELLASPGFSETASAPRRRRGRVNDHGMEKLLRADKGLVIRPVRLLTLGSLLFPSPDRLLRYYGMTHSWQLPWLYLRHPFHVVRKVWTP